jgi:hypothetical protein
MEGSGYLGEGFCGWGGVGVWVKPGDVGISTTAEKGKRGVGREWR